MNGRATQLDGLRGLAMLGVAWFHWSPKKWQGGFPFEIGLFFFFVLTGFLITTILLRDRAKGEATGKPWRASGLITFQTRRALRILAPYYAALALAWVIGATDVREAPWWYVFHLSNFHIAAIGTWPPGTSQFWTLAVQQQFYVVWPLLIWFFPVRLLGPLIAILGLVAPLWRLKCGIEGHEGGLDLMPWTALDYLCTGSLLAWWVARGGKLDNPRLRWFAWWSFVAYVALYSMHEWSTPVPGLRYFQQTFLSVACAGLIASAFTGIRGFSGAALKHPVFQHLGKLSYSLYLLHNLAPMAVGWVLPGLWSPGFDHGIGFVARLAVFAAASWLLGYSSWRFIERPLESVKARMPVAS